MPALLNIRTALFWVVVCAFLHFSPEASAFYKLHSTPDSIAFYEEMLEVAEDGEKVGIYNKLYWAYININYDQAYAIVEKGLNLANKLDDQKGRFGLLICLANYYRSIDDYKQAIEVIQEALQITQSFPQKDQGNVLLTMGKLYHSIGETRLAISYLNQAYEIGIAENWPWFQAKCLHELAEVRINLGDNEKAKQHLRRAIFIFDSLENTVSAPWSSLFLGNILQQERQFDSAKLFLHSSAAMFKEQNNLFGLLSFHRYLAANYRNQGFFAESLKQYDSAFFYGNQIAPNGTWLPVLQLAKAEALVSSNQLADANQVLQQLEDMPNLTAINKEFLSQLQAIFHFKTKDFEQAYLYLEKASNIEKARREQNVFENFNAYDLLFEVEQKAYENKLLEKEIELRQSEERQKIALASAIFLLIISAVILLYNKRRNRYMNLLRLKNLHIVAQQNDLQATNQMLEETNEELSALNEELSGLNEEKDSMIKIITHDLKAPLNRMAGLLDLLEMDLEAGTKATNMLYISLIKQVIQEGSNSIHRLLDLKNLEEKNIRLRPEIFYVAAYLEELKNKFSDLANKKNIKITISAPNTDISLHTDLYYFARIMENLISNAVKYCFSDGQITLSCFEMEDKIRLEVADTGPGIKPEEENLLFKKFQRLSSRPTGNESSTGLGLAIVKGVSEWLGGDISYKPAPGHGAVFILVLPKKLS